MMLPLEKFADSFGSSDLMTIGFWKVVSKCYDAKKRSQRLANPSIESVQLAPTPYFSGQ